MAVGFLFESANVGLAERLRPRLGERTATLANHLGVVYKTPPAFF